MTPTTLARQILEGGNPRQLLPDSPAAVLVGGGSGVGFRAAGRTRRPGAARQVGWQARYARVLMVLDLFLPALLAVGILSSSRGPVGAVVGLVSAAGWLAAVYAARGYELRFLGAGGDEYRRLLDTAVRLAAGGALVLFLAGQADVIRPVEAALLPGFAAVGVVTRLSVRLVLQRLRRDGRCLHRVLVVGRERSCAELIRQLRLEQAAGFLVVGACINTAREPLVEAVPVVGTSRDVMSAVERTGADTVAVGAWSDLSQDDLRRLSWQLEGTGVDLVVAPALTDVVGQRLHIRPVAGVPLLHVEEPELTGARRLVKHAVDRILAAALLIVLLPLLLIIGVIVRLTSPGGALFKQERVGAGGGTFRMWKFRSMYADAEARRGALAVRNEVDGPLFKLREDPRVTPVGRVLRQLSLDELPQLVNVLLGHMSLVGPRPPLASEVEVYADDVHRRLLVRPGITGLWQISGRSDLTWRESVRLDLMYVENWSLALDAAILMRTVLAVATRRGAY